MQPRAPVLALLAALAVGCGAKTGLEVPEAGPDGGSDGGTDAGMVPPCVEVPLDGGLIELPLDIEAELARADVLFLVDNTLSMEAEIGQVRERLRDTITPGIAQTIPDSAIGVATFGDFPEPMCGEAGDEPFTLVLPISEDLNRVQAAVDAMPMGMGSDRPESQVEALYQTATGEGIGGYVPPSFGCPTGGLGYPCFRLDALPVILLFTDAPFHNGPGGTNPYRCPVVPTPHTYSEAVTALDRLNARVIGLYSGTGEGRTDLVQIALDTNAVAGGDALVFDIGERGERLSESVVNAVQTLADTITFDVDTVLADPDPTDGIDPRDFVDAVVPVRAEPMSNIDSIDVDAGAFRGVRAGTRVFFQLRIRGGVIMPGPEPQRFLLEVVFRGDGRTRLGSRLVEIVVPAIDGSGCEGL